MMDQERGDSRCVRIGEKIAPPVALGCAYLGTRQGLDESLALLDAFYECGGRIVDTANSYAAWIEGATGGESETAIGRWLSSRGVAGEMIVVTKAGYGYAGVPDGAAPGLLARECEKSLRRLGLERVDAFLVHRKDESVEPRRLAETLLGLRERGLASEIGVSNYDERSFDELDSLASGGLTVLQNHFPVLPCAAPESLAGFGWTAPDEAALGRAAARGVTVMAHTPLLWGYAVRPGPLPPAYDSPAARLARDAILESARETGRDPASIALGLLAGPRPPIVPVFGASRPEQVRAALRGLAR